MYWVVPAKLKEIDEIIVRLHTTGECLFDAMARARVVHGADLDHFFDFLKTLAGGEVLLKNAKKVPLPDLDVNGIAMIVTYWLRYRDYEAATALGPGQPSLPDEWIRCELLHSVLEKAGYRAPAGGWDWRFEPKALKDLAEAAGLHPKKVYRIVKGHQKRVKLDDAEAILNALDVRLPEDEADAAANDDRAAGAVAAIIDARDAEKSRPDTLNALTKEMFRWYLFIARTRKVTERKFDAHEVVFLDDIEEHYRLSLSPGYSSASTAFEETHKRPLTWPPPAGLRTEAERHLRAEASRTRQAACDARKGLHDGGRKITVANINTRTSRLHAAGVLPCDSKPKTFKPKV